MMSGSFDDLVSSGSSIAAVPVEREDFAALVRAVNERFGLTLTPQQDAFEVFQDRIRFVAGRFWEEYERVRRQKVLERLRQLTVWEVTRRPTKLGHWLPAVFHPSEDGPDPV
jgi:hypothetical protein